MMKNILIAVLGVAVVALAVVVVLQWGGEDKTGGDSPPPTHGPVPPTTTTTQPPPPPPPELPTSVTNKLPELKRGDTERIPSEADGPQEITSIFEAKAKGTYAKWGGAADADLYYLLKLVATTKVESKEESESGKVRVEEIRSFHEATEVIKPANVSPRVDLSTVPLDQIESTGLLLGGLISVLGAPDLGDALSTAVSDFRDQVESLDGLEGKPVIDFLQQFGIDVKEILDKPVEDYLNGLMDKVHSHVNAVQGKSYRFVYWTDKEGEPLRVRYENVDHSPISLEEQNVLNYVNLFIDCHVLPDMSKKPGESWTVGASAVASMFGAIADGTCVGDVTMRRGNDTPDHYWDIAIEPATITLVEDKRPIGNVKIDGGKAKGDPRRAVLRELQINGHGKLRKHETETKLWFYDFVTKIEGDCEFRSTLLPRREE